MIDRHPHDQRSKSFAFLTPVSMSSQFPLGYQFLGLLVYFQCTVQYDSSTGFTESGPEASDTAKEIPKITPNKI